MAVPKTAALPLGYTPRPWGRCIASLDPLRKSPHRNSRWSISATRSSHVAAQPETGKARRCLLREERLAGVEGFEPSHGGTKNRCLTAWLHPKAVGTLYSEPRSFAQVSTRANFDGEGPVFPRCVAKPSPGRLAAVSIRFKLAERQAGLGVSAGKRRNSPLPCRGCSQFQKSDIRQCKSLAGSDQLC